jgi:hypothetical protein
LGRADLYLRLSGIIMKKFIKIFFVIVLVGLAAYFLFGKSNNSNYKIPDIKGINLNSGNIISVASSTVENIKNKTKDIFSGVTSDLKTKAEEIVSSAIEKTKNYALSVFKQGVESGINKLGESAGITVNSPENLVPENKSPVIYSIKKGEPSYFTVKNSEDELKYEVDWLDGKKDIGQITQKSESVVLSHKWIGAGEYPITFKIVDSKGEKEYKILITVID